MTISLEYFFVLRGATTPLFNKSAATFVFTAVSLAKKALYKALDVPLSLVILYPLAANFFVAAPTAIFLAAADAGDIPTNVNPKSGTKSPPTPARSKKNPPPPKAEESALRSSFLSCN